MANRDDEFRRGVERPQFGAYDGEGDEHGEPREFRYGRDFDKPEHGRWAEQEREDVFSRPYDRWSSPGYVFYAGKGYHREFIDPSAGPVEGRRGAGWYASREARRGPFGAMARGARPSPFTGRGPKGYVRSDGRIREEVNERLEEHGQIDASDITVRVSDREVTLEGTVDDRRTKRLVEDVAESVHGVADVHNRLRIAPRGTEVDVEVQGPTSHSGTGFLTENRETSRPRPR